MENENTTGIHDNSIAVRFLISFCSILFLIVSLFLKHNGKINTSCEVDMLDEVVMQELP